MSQQGRLEAPVVEQRFDQGLLVPGVQPTDRLADRPGDERVGIAQGRVQRRPSPEVAQPAGGDRRFATNRRVAIAEKRKKLPQVRPVTAYAHRSRGLEAHPGRTVGQHRPDRPSRIGPTDRVEGPQGVQAPGLGLGGLEPLDQERNHRRPLARENPLRFQADSQRRVIERPEPHRRVIACRTQGAARPGVGPVKRSR